MARNPDVEGMVKGRWPGILAALGIDRKLLNGRHQPCPVCGGTDRFRFNRRHEDGMWACNGACRGGDGFQLLEAVKGWSFREAADAIRDLLGTTKIEATKMREESTDDQRARLNDLWRSGAPLKVGDAADLYLRARGFDDVELQDLRFCDQCDVVIDGERTARPAMLAMIRDASGRPVSIHKTFLGHKKKADMPSPRRFMSGINLPGGCAVRLCSWKPGDELGIAEGIETAIAASLIFKVPVWAALTAGGLGSWEPPAGVKRVWIFGDCDHSYTGEWRMFELAHRLAGKKIEVEPLAPNVRGRDWADVYIEGKAETRKEAMEELGEYYSEDEVRLMRIKFMSEHAH